MPKKRRDTVQNARRVVDESIRRSSGSNKGPSASTISEVMREMGRKGGKVGGKRRLETMTPEARKAAAQKAIRARWAKARKDPK